jgi:hypothetical protein
VNGYEELDGRIIAAVRNRKHPLYDFRVNAEAGRIAIEMGRDAFRVIDGRITALKDKGLIVHKTKSESNGQGGWHLK